MTTEQIISLLTAIAERQAGDSAMSRGTSPATLMIGYVDEGNIVRHDGVVILKAPPAIHTTVVAWLAEMSKTDRSGLPVTAAPGFGGLVIR